MVLVVVNMGGERDEKCKERNLSCILRIPTKKFPILFTLFEGL